MQSSNNRFLNTEYRKYPSIFTVLPFAAGILSAYFLNISFLNSSIIWFLVVLLALTAVIVYLRLLPDFLKNKLFPVYAFLLLILGFFRYQQTTDSIKESHLASILGESKEHEVLLYGSVIEQPEFTNDYVRLLVAADSIISNRMYSSEIKVLCRIYRNRYSEQVNKNIKYGDAVTIRGTLEKLPHKRNPGEFDYGRYLKIHGIDAVLNSYGFGNIVVSESSSGDFFNKTIIYPVKTYSAEIIDKMISGSEAEFMKGLVLGERSGISKQTKEDFVNAGVAHIIAVSGLNVAYVLICISLLLTFVPLEYKYKVFILILFLIFYMNLTGNMPSIVRAVIMASVFLIAKLIERKPNWYSITAFSAFIILIYDPLQMFDAGFILSFSAVLSIIWIYPKLETLISKFKFYDNLDERNYFSKALKLMITYLLVTLSAQLGILPISAIMFEKISVVSIFVNLLVIPLSNLAMGTGFLVILTSLVSFWLASVFAAAASAILYLLLWFINFSAGFDISFIETYSFDAVLLLFYYLLLFTLFAVNKANYRAKFAVAAVLIANLFLIEPILYSRENVTLAYLDTGNSNACLISCQNKYNFMINSGTSSGYYNSAENTVIPYLKRNRINKVDILFLSGLDFNEFRNLVYLVINFPVTKIFLPGYYKTLFENKFVKKVFSKSELTFAETSPEINTYDNVRFKILPNQKSMSIYFYYGETGFIFADSNDSADISGQKVLRLIGETSFDHYSPEFILKENPEFIITSYSRSKKKKKQANIFETALNKVGIETVNVSNSGAVILESDGNNIKFINWK